MDQEMICTPITPLSTVESEAAAEPEIDDDDDETSPMQNKFTNGLETFDPNNNNSHQIKPTTNKTRECFAFAVC